MTYELAKELKDAGFPQKPHVPLSIPRMNIQEVEHVDIPTLSELIEACGEHMQLDWFPKTNTAYANCCDRNDHQHTGSTPLEAVARLWLALNKPSTEVEG